VIDELRNCFPKIQKISFDKTENIIDPKTGGEFEIISFNEKNICSSIPQNKWSDGIVRILHLLMSVKVPFSNSIGKPSLILIDEIENGLDFKRLQFIINYLKDHADDSQIIFSSHSPIVCEMVHPKHWIVVRREGSKISLDYPGVDESKLKETLEFFKQEHWELYSRHLANPDL
jgi:predicted ATPase